MNPQQKFLCFTQPFLKKNPVIFEVGSRDGDEAAYFATQFSSGKIFAFECNPLTLPLCYEKEKSYLNIKIVPFAVSDTEGKIPFYTTNNSGNPGSSSLFQMTGKYKPDLYKSQEIIEVSSTTLSSFMEQQKIKSVDIIWMDLQGAELKALKGLSDRLDDVHFIFIEVEFFEIYSGQPLWKDIKKFLKKNSFIPVGFTDRSEHFGNAVFVNAQKMSWVNKLYFRFRGLRYFGIPFGKADVKRYLRRFKISKALLVFLGK